MKVGIWHWWEWAERTGFWVNRVKILDLLPRERVGFYFTVTCHPHLLSHQASVLIGWWEFRGLSQGQNSILYTPFWLPWVANSGRCASGQLAVIFPSWHGNSHEVWPIYRKRVGDLIQNQIARWIIILLTWWLYLAFTFKRWYFIRWQVSVPLLPPMSLRSKGIFPGVESRTGGCHLPSYPCQSPLPWGGGGGVGPVL